MGKWTVVCLVMLTGCRTEEQHAPAPPLVPPSGPPSASSSEQPLDPSLSVSPAAARTVPSTGGTPLQGPWHMRDHLASANVWKGPVFWRFNEDGTFVIWIEGPLDQDLDSRISIPIPAGETRLTGNWQATTTELQLSNVTTGAGKPVRPFTLDLGWVDGKLHIDIGGFRYSRWSPK